MNWTGGRLSRHSRKVDGSTVSKQKQHFAKVRTNLMNGSAKRNPAKWSIFDKIAVTSHGATSVKPATFPANVKRPSTILNHDIRPMITHTTPYRKLRRDPEEEEEQYKPPKHGDEGNLAQKQVNGYGTIAQPVFIAESANGDDESQDEVEAIRRKKLTILRNGDWVGLSIQRPLHLKYAPSGNQDGIGKRRRLNSGDEARYVKAKDKILSPFAPNRHIRRTDISTDHEQNLLTILGDRALETKGDVRIFIDGRERRIGASSSTAPNRPIIAHMQSSSSSDIMLLDLEGGRVGLEKFFEANLYKEANTNDRLPVFKPLERSCQSSRRESASSYGGYSSSGPHAHRRRGTDSTAYLQRYQLQQLRGATTLGTPSHMVNRNFPSSNAPPDLSSRERLRLNDSTNQLDTYPLIQSQSVSKYRSSGSDLSRKQKRESLFDSQQNDHRPAKTRRLIMPSSPPVIHHPIPRSSATSRVLRSDSSELGNSIAATAGVKHSATASEAEDEEMWKSWLVGENDNEEGAPGAFVEGERARPVSTSPGISTYIQHNISDKWETESVQSWLSRPPSGGPKHQGRVSSGTKLTLTASSRTSSVTGHGAPGKKPFKNPVTMSTVKMAEPSDFNIISKITKQPTTEAPEEIAREEPADEAWKAFVLTEPIKSLAKMTVMAQKSAPREDPDAAWKKFVLSSDSDGEDLAFNTAWKKDQSIATSSGVRMQHSSSETSILIHPAETILGSEKHSTASSNISSFGDTFNPSAYPAPSIFSSREASASAVGGESMYPNYQPSKVSLMSNTSLPSSEISEVCLVPEHRRREDPLSRYMPAAPQPKRRVIFTKPPPFSGLKQSFEEGLDGSLREALYLGKRYTRQEREGRKMGHREGKRDIYEIPMSDDVEDIDED